MEIQTKYNIGDKVWIMRNDKPEQILISTKTFQYLLLFYH